MEPLTLTKNIQNLDDNQLAAVCWVLHYLDHEHEQTDWSSATTKTHQALAAEGNEQLMLPGLPHFVDVVPGASANVAVVSDQFCEPDSAQLKSEYTLLAICSLMVLLEIVSIL